MACFGGGGGGRMRHMFKKTLWAMLMLASLVPAWAAEWMTDLEAAKTKAAAENKAVLIDFTGSDWCGWCIRLRKQVLDTPAFEDYVKDKFVLAEIDLPRNPKFDAKLRARNEEICNQYGVSGFPTVLVITPKGEVIGGFSGYLESVEAVSKSLAPALTTAELLKKAETQQGAEQLASLAQAYQGIPDELRGNATGLRDRILALDPQDTTGLGRLQRVQEQRAAFMESVRGARTPKETISIIDAALATAEPENKPGMLQIKFQVLFMSAETVDDIKAAAEVMRESIQATPNADPQAVKRLESLLENPEETLQRLRDFRNRGAKAASQK